MPGALETWDAKAVQDWLTEQPALGKYTGQLEGTTGKDFMCLTDDMLKEAGIVNGMHRMMLLNRRNELLQTPAPPGSPSIPARRSSGSMMARLPSTQGSGNWVQDLNIVRLVAAGEFVLEPLKSAERDLQRVLPLMVTSYKYTRAASYNQANGCKLLEAAVRLQLALISDPGSKHSRELGTHLVPLMESIASFLSVFSAWGWLARLKTVKSDLADFERLHNACALLCTEHKLQLPPQEYTDATAELRQHLCECCGEECFQQPDQYEAIAQKAVVKLDQPRSTPLMESLAMEAALLGANHAQGCHSVLRHPKLRVFWWRNFPTAEEIPWDTFWGAFPKTLPSASVAVELGKLFVSKAQREVFQAMVGRRTQQAVTSAELDFMCPPTHSLLVTVTSMLQADAAARNLSSWSGARSLTPNLAKEAQTRLHVDMLPVMPRMVQGLEGSQESLLGLLETSARIVNIVAAPGFGKTMLASSVALHMVTGPQWGAAYWVDLHGCTNDRAAIFAFLAACGVPSDVPDAAALLAWLARAARNTTIGLVIACGPSLPSSVRDTLSFLLARITRTVPTAQVMLLSGELFSPAGLDIVPFNLGPLSLADCTTLIQQAAPKATATKQLAELCEGSPAACQLVAAAIAFGCLSDQDVLEHPDQLHRGNSSTKLLRITRAVMCELEEDQLHALLMLSMLPGSFTLSAAEEALGMAGTPCLARSMLRCLEEMHLLRRCASTRWRLHACVRSVAVQLSSELGLSHATVKEALAAYCSRALRTATTLAGTYCPLSAAHLLIRDNITLQSMVTWVSKTNWHHLASMLWRDMRQLAMRLDNKQRLGLCWAVHDLAKEDKDTAWVGRLLCQVGLLYSDVGQFAKAGPYFSQALSILEGELGPSHLHLANVCNGLAVVKYKLGHWKEVQDLFARAYDIQSTHLEPDHADLAATMSHSAGLLKAMSKLGDAEIVYRTVLEMRERTLGPEHAEVAGSLNNLAVLLKGMGRYEEAQALYAKSIRIKEKALGPAHPQVALSLNNLAALLRKTGRQEEAEQLYRRALSIYEDDYGMDHPQVASSYANLAGLLRGQYRYGEAQAFTRKALEIRSHTLPATHPDLAAAHISLAHLLLELGQYEEAVSECQKAVRVLEDGAADGQNNPNVATALCLQAESLLCLKRPDEALKLAERGLEIRSTVLGARHADTGAALGQLASVLLQMGRLEDAERRCKAALAVLGDQEGSDTPPLADILVVQARLRVAQEKLPEAEEDLRRCLRIREGVSPPDKLGMAEAQAALAAVLQVQGSQPEAEGCWGAALTARESILGLQHPLSLSAQQGLEQLTKAGCTAGDAI